VKVHGREMGAGLVRLLDDRNNERIPPDVPIRMLFTGRLVVRASTGIAKVPCRIPSQDA